MIDFDFPWVHQNVINVLFYPQRFSIPQATHLDKDEHSVKESNEADNGGDHGVDAQEISKPLDDSILQIVLL